MLAASGLLLLIQVTGVLCVCVCVTSVLNLLTAEYLVPYARDNN